MSSTQGAPPAGFGGREDGTAAADCECLYECLSDDLSWDEFSKLGGDSSRWPERAQEVAEAAGERCLS